MTLYIKLAIALILALAGFFGGCHCQRGANDAEVARKDRALDKAASDLRTAQGALQADAQAFRAINEATAAAEHTAAQELQAAEESAAAARAAERATQGRVTGLERQLEAEKSSCIDGRRPICGLPLR